MPMPIRAQAGLMITATVTAAAGLNLGVLGLNQNDQPAVGSEEAAAATPESEVAPAVVQPPVETDTAPVVALTSSSSVAAVSPSGIAAPSDRLDGKSKLEDPSPTAGTEPEPTAGQDQSPATNPPSSDPAAGVTAPADTKPPATMAPETTPPPTAPPASTPQTTLPDATSTSGRPPTTERSDETPTTAAPITEYLTYEFDGVAEIIVALHDGERLEFWSAIPEPGWAFRVDDDEARKVKIKFRPLDGGDEAEFEVKLENGRLKVKKEH